MNTVPLRSAMIASVIIILTLSPNFAPFLLAQQPLATPVTLELNTAVTNGVPEGVDEAGFSILNNALIIAPWGAGYGIYRLDALAPVPGFQRLSTYVARSLATCNGTVFMSASSTNLFGLELAKTNGTSAGTTIFKDLNTKTDVASDPNTFIPFNTTQTIFRAGVESYQTKIGRTIYNIRLHELCMTDGTATGTVPLTKGKAWNVMPASMTMHNGNLFCFMQDISGKVPTNTPPATLSGLELWKSNGTATGTVRIKDINPGTADCVPRDQNDAQFGGTKFYYNRMVAIENDLFFLAGDGVNGYELWKTNGTAAGTGMVADIFPGPQSGYPAYLTAMNGSLYFAARESDTGDKLMRYTPSNNTLEIVADMNPGTAPNDSSWVRWLTVAGGKLFFSAYDPEHGHELWVSDGIPVSKGGDTHMAADINPTGSSYPNLEWTNPWPQNTPLEEWYDTPGVFTVHNGIVYFAANDGTHGIELWRSNGVTTQLVTDINTDPGKLGGSSDNYYRSIANNKLFFLAYEFSTGYELRMIDLGMLPTPKESRTDADLPSAVSLAQNFPNPFNPSTVIEYALPADAGVRLSVHDMLGREVAVLVDALRTVGTHRVSFDASALAGGSYLARLDVDGRIVSRMMHLLK